MHKFFLPPLAATALALLSACSGGGESNGPAPDTKDPLAKLEIMTAKAEVAVNVPLGSVPGQISLPPEARVAVTAPFPGAAVRVYVLEGQAVTRGQPLALVRASEPIQIRGELARSQAELSLAEARARRMEQLAREGIVARARADESVAQLLQARASVAENQRLIALAGAGGDGSMTLRAPISGRVSHVGVETGGSVSEMSAPFVVDGEGAYQVDLQLPERLARDVRPGMPIEISLGAVDGKNSAASGRVLSVSPSIDPMTRSVSAKASIANAIGLVAGRNVMVTISGPGKSDGVSVPSSAVTRIGSDAHVFVRSGKAYVRRKVSVVSDVGGRAAISEGLKAGEIVAASSITELKAMTAE
jgi:cobalt-zinc-cadmium efflux system membrane fusion protein